MTDVGGEALLAIQGLQEAPSDRRGNGLDTAAASTDEVNVHVLVHGVVRRRAVSEMRMGDQADVLEDLEHLRGESASIAREKVAEWSGLVRGEGACGVRKRGRDGGVLALQLEERDDLVQMVGGGARVDHDRNIPEPLQPPGRSVPCRGPRSAVQPGPSP